ncbi:hypothetical protein [Curtobacterium oceanosedimentum]|uniref:hypothetical protein n=1 Tax=Curtobacterium oceanosedimentum TaxID=465820 RepID=UPI001CE1C26A|nr:hypothetical protein [Curtobacterium oceanosedimentum]MCA5924918.1 hypothetical protein [Curtobacterium oceanosedimentum]
MPDDIDANRRTPAWLWVLFAFGLAVFGTGSFLARVEGHLYGVLILAVGLAIVLTFVVLRGRHASKR